MALAVELTKLGLAHRLTWKEIADLIAAGELDVEQALEDRDFRDWWEGKDISLYDLARWAQR